MGVLRQNRMAELQPRQEEIGRLFKGSKKQAKTTKAGKEYLGYGEDLSYFRFEPSERLKNLPSSSHPSLYDELTAKWQNMEQVTHGWRSVPILLPYRGLDANFKWRNAVYDGGGRTLRSCDGTICDRRPLERTNAQGKKVTTVIRGGYQCAMGPDDTECPAGCKAEGKLAMIIPALYPGLILLTTRSLIDIQTIQANLEAYRRFDLSRIPLRLCRSLRDASYTTADGEYKKQEKWLLHIEIDPQVGMMALEAQQQQYRAELAGGVNYLPDQSARALPLASVEVEAFISKSEAVDLWNMAKGNGWTQEQAKEVLSKYGVESFNEIPIDKYGAIGAVFNQPVAAVAVVPELVEEEF